MNKVVIISVSLFLAMAAGLSACAAPSPPKAPPPWSGELQHYPLSIDDIFLSRWGYTYYNNAPRVSYNPFDIDKLLIQISVQIPWQLYYQAGAFDSLEMTAYLEYVLERHGYTAQICRGETVLGEHAWVLVYNNVARYWIPIEATSPTGTLDAILFHLVARGMVIDCLKPQWKWTSIYDVIRMSEYDWWNSPYADQLVEASDKAKLPEPLPPLPEIKYADLPPLPELPKSKLPPLPEITKPELPSNTRDEGQED